jgi:hypothetical protein
MHSGPLQATLFHCVLALLEIIARAAGERLCGAIMTCDGERGKERRESSASRGRGDPRPFPIGELVPADVDKRWIRRNAWSWRAELPGRMCGNTHSRCRSAQVVSYRIARRRAYRAINSKLLIVCGRCAHPCGLAQPERAESHEPFSVLCSLRFFHCVFAALELVARDALTRRAIFVGNRASTSPGARSRTSPRTRERCMKRHARGLFWGESFA